MAYEYAKADFSLIKARGGRSRKRWGLTDEQRRCVENMAARFIRQLVDSALVLLLFFWQRYVPFVRNEWIAFQWLFIQISSRCLSKGYNIGKIKTDGNTPNTNHTQWLVGRGDPCGRPVPWSPCAVAALCRGRPPVFAEVDFTEVAGDLCC